MLDIIQQMGILIKFRF